MVMCPLTRLASIRPRGGYDSGAGSSGAGADLDEDCAEQGIGDHHGEPAAAALAADVPAEVVEPVRLHVASKRDLCAVDPAYLDALLAAPRLSLLLQGGPFTPAEVADVSGLPTPRTRRGSAAGTTSPRLPTWRRRRSSTTARRSSPAVGPRPGRVRAPTSHPRLAAAGRPDRARSPIRRHPDDRPGTRPLRSKLRAAGSRTRTRPEAR
jgi:hypothetical protein